MQKRQANYLFPMIFRQISMQDSRGNISDAKITMRGGVVILIMASAR